MEIKSVRQGQGESYGWSVSMTATVVSDTKPDPEEVAAKAGYHPAGYGCYNPTVNRFEPGGFWIVSWDRAKSCD